MKVLSVTQGFITNSSSAVHAFDMRLLEVPEIKTFMQKFGVTKGFVGRDMWYRGQEDSFLLTAAQKEEALADTSDYGKDSPPIPTDPAMFVLVYCDETDSLVHTFCTFIEDWLTANKEAKYEHWQNEYN